MRSKVGIFSYCNPISFLASQKLKSQKYNATSYSIAILAVSQQQDVDGVKRKAELISYYYLTRSSSMESQPKKVVVVVVVVFIVIIIVGQKT